MDTPCYYVIDTSQQWKKRETFSVDETILWNGE